MLPVNVEVQAIGTELIRHVRLVQLLRARMTEWNPSGLDWSATSLLAHLVRGGPKRQGELAACAMLDPSTVSRQVGQLIRLGLAERRPDPADGRAVQLVATDAGQRCYAEITERREQLIGEVLAGWSEQDLTPSAGCCASSTTRSRRGCPTPAASACAARSPDLRRTE